MKDLRVVVCILIVISFFSSIFLYYYHHSTVHGHRLRLVQTVEPSNISQDSVNHLLEKISKDKNKYFWTPHYDDTVIDTPGCQIPLVAAPYKRYPKLKNPATCGKRAVFLKRNSDGTVTFVIKPNIMKKYLRKTAQFTCCYQYVEFANRSWGRDYKISVCKDITRNESYRLESDIITIWCSELGEYHRNIYTDSFAYPKRVNRSPESRKNQSCNAEKYNVLILGMDFMSQQRFDTTMPLTAEFFEEKPSHRFRGYHKVDENIYPPLMAAFTGQDEKEIKERCAKRMNECNDYIIWSLFKRNGYVTAFGEDYLLLTEKATIDFVFKTAPTDHYMRLLFSYRENELNNRTLVCLRKRPSAEYILDYILDLASVYKNDPFFGLFWIHSYSHHENSRPQDADRMLSNFFKKLFKTGITDKTFVIFLSDQGMNFGDNILKLDSYYDNRLPVMYVWVPPLFLANHPNENKHLSENQFRLLTPYDVYNTLREINEMSSCQDRSQNTELSYSEACPKCSSLFRELSTTRTCEDVAIQPHLCTCHKLLPLSPQDKEGKKSVTAVTSFIQNRVESIILNPCWECLNVTVKSILRMHYYIDRDNIVYDLVAFTITAANVKYEATVLRNGEDREIVGPVRVFSLPRKWKECIDIQSPSYETDRLYCVCHKKKKCYL